MDLTIEDQVLAYVVETFLGGGDSSLDVESPLVELGILNSMRLLRLVAWIQQEFGVTISVAEESALNSARATAVLIREFRRDG